MKVSLSRVLTEASPSVIKSGIIPFLIDFFFNYEHNPRSMDLLMFNFTNAAAQRESGFSRDFWTRL